MIAETPPSDSELVTTRIEDFVGIITLARPEKSNAIRRQTLSLIAHALDSFEEPGSGVNVILVKAEGRHFCTGGDLSEAQTMSGDSAALDEFLRFVGTTLRRFESSPLPVVIACHGLTLAGGLEIALCGDVVFAAEDARFGDQHVQYGLIPAWGASQRLPQRVGLNRSLDLMYSGRWIDALTAQQWGLVNYVSNPESVHADALAYCRNLAKRSRPGVRAMKRLARREVAHLESGLEAEREAVVEIMEGPDPAEGLSAFMERREPRFADR